MYRRLFRLPNRLRRRARRSRLFTMFLLLSIISIVLLPFYIIYKPPPILIRYFSHKWPKVLFQVVTKDKLIALTIDDGPSDYTREILQILQDNDAHATWFVIGGQIPGKEGVLKELVEAGMELGNHAMHDEPSRSLADDELSKQIVDVEGMIHQAYDDADISASYPAKFFRPGSGFFSQRMLQLLEKLDYRLVLGSIYPHDPQVPYAWINARHILSMLRPGGIVVCHDRRSWTVPMLKKVVPEIRRRGYRIVTVGRLLEAATSPDLAGKLD
ncbi:carbohydrate esterase family 4 protein [Amniculicola lignicola CBS 123094]|uniref:chitin deacetylase n=1 Tax=Amniculicola lignicola CBS 123094 TaxID=1392246 RepID=A0A6A5W9R5_9PLEO|nr:carbohydrate esterase family 4 protein [Amniculicola lignicola CBS 123094]